MSDPRDDNDPVSVVADMRRQHIEYLAGLRSRVLARQLAVDERQLLGSVAGLLGQLVEKRQIEGPPAEVELVDEQRTEEQNEQRTEEQNGQRQELLAAVAVLMGQLVARRRAQGEAQLHLKPPQTYGQYMPGLDGLRALAVFAVILYHLRIPWAVGGFNGVTLFFVLSGYLITDLLLKEWRRDGGIALKNFWFRRAKRLLPAVFTLLICVTVYVAIFRRDMLANLSGDLLPAAFYYSNWWYVLHHVSYFQSFDPQLLNHFWSLAVEEQFYIFWPLLLIGILVVFRKRPKFVVPAIVALALASALAMALMYMPDHDPSRIYYGTDTRAFSLLVGAAVAYVVPSAKLRLLKLDRLGRVLAEALGAAALIGCVCILVFTDQFSPFVYRGGMLLFSVLCIVLILVAAHPDTWIGKAFSVAPLTAVGKISYGLYLWQYPVILLTDPEINVGGIVPWRCAAQVALATGLAAASYFFIDNPIRRADTMRAVGQLVVRRKPGSRKVPVAAALPLLMALTMVGVSALFATTNLASAAPPSAPTPSVTVMPSVPWTNRPTRTPTPTSDPALTAKITMIGDSIAIDVAPMLSAHYPNIVVDGSVSRSFAVASTILSDHIAKGTLGDIVILELGTNGAFLPPAMRDVINLIGPDRLILFVNVNVPRSWTPTVNNTIATVAPEYPNVRVVDWYSASLGHPEYFWKDAVHPNEDGSKVLTALIVEAIGW